MTWARAIGSAPITAASAALGVEPAPAAGALRGALAATFLAAGLAADVFAAFVPVALVPPWLVAACLVATAARVRGVAAVLRGGNLLGANSKLTLPSAASHTSMALKARRVRIETNLSSRSVLPVLSSLCICSR